MLQLISKKCNFYYIKSYFVNGNRAYLYKDSSCNWLIRTTTVPPPPQGWGSNQLTALENPEMFCCLLQHSVESLLRPCKWRN